MTTLFLSASLLLVLTFLEAASGYKPDAICNANLALKATDPLVFYEIINPEDKTANVQAKASSAQEKTPERKGRVIVGKRTIELTNQYGTKPLSEWKEQCRQVPVIFVVTCDPTPAFHYCIPVCPEASSSLLPFSSGQTSNRVQAAVAALVTQAKPQTNAKKEPKSETEKQPDGKLNWTCNDERYQILCQDVGETAVARLSNDAKCMQK